MRLQNLTCTLPHQSAPSSTWLPGLHDAHTVPTVFKLGGTMSSRTDLALDSVHDCTLSSPGNVVGIKWTQASSGMILSFSTHDMGCQLPPTLALRPTRHTARLPNTTILGNPPSACTRTSRLSYLGPRLPESWFRAESLLAVVGAGGA